MSHDTFNDDMWMRHCFPWNARHIVQVTIKETPMLHGGFADYEMLGTLCRYPSRKPDCFMANS